MTRASLLLFLVVGVLAPLLSSQVGDGPPPKDDTPAPTPADWKGEPLRIVAGLNAGTRKILLRMTAEEGKRPHCELAFRVNDRENLQKDIFRPYLPPERLIYTGSAPFAEGGAEWTEHRFESAVGVRIAICRPVKKLGPLVRERFEIGRFDFDEENLPYALAKVIDPNSTLYFPVRDISAFDDPKKALLEDLVPFEKRADRVAVVWYIVEKIGSAEPKQQIALLERLERFETAELQSAIATILQLREHGTPEVKEAARRVAARHGFYSDGDLIRAIAELESADFEVVHQAVVRIRAMGPKALPKARPPLERLLERPDVPERTAKLARALIS